MTTDRPLEVLVIDDEESVAEVFKDMIEEQGDIVTVAHGGQDGIREYVTRLTEVKNNPQSGKRSFDLVLTDLAMPVVTGYDVVKVVKEKSPTTPIYVITANSFQWSDECQKKGELAPDGLLVKPIQIDILQGVINKTRDKVYAQPNGDCQSPSSQS